MGEKRKKLKKNLSQHINKRTNRNRLCLSKEHFYHSLIYFLTHSIYKIINQLVKESVSQSVNRATNNGVVTRPVKRGKISPRLASDHLHRTDKRCPLGWSKYRLNTTWCLKTSCPSALRQVLRTFLHTWGILVGYRTGFPARHQSGVPSTPGRKCRDMAAICPCAVTLDTSHR